MSSPAAASYQDPQTKQWYVYDAEIQGYVPAESTPDVSTVPMPEAFKRVFNEAGPGVVDAINTSAMPGEKWTNTFTRIATSLGLGVQQYQLMNLNVQRARQGLPPIDVATYAGAGVNVGLSAGTQQLVTYAGLALIGLVLLNMATKR